MKQKEIERVFLLNYLPSNINKMKMINIKVGDFYNPNSSNTLKIKQKGDLYFLVKKYGHNTLNRVEHIIELNKGEFDVLWKSTIQNHEKIRYLSKLNGRIYELDLYLGKLKGYARVEVEFDSRKEAKEFLPPNWFGYEITSINHEIHENLGIITFNDIKKRYYNKKIVLKKIDYNNLKK